MAFHGRFSAHFQGQTRSVVTAAGQYLKGLMQAERKNMERMEEAVKDCDEQRLQHMLTDSAWDHRGVLDQVAKEADAQLGGSAESGLLIDESGFAKKGIHSVGVARQWCGRLGQVDNGQVGVFAALGQGHLAALTDVRLFVPEAWAGDEQRGEVRQPQAQPPRNRHQPDPGKARERLDDETHPLRRDPFHQARDQQRRTVSPRGAQHLRIGQGPPRHETHAWNANGQRRDLRR